MEQANLFAALGIETPPDQDIPTQEITYPPPGEAPGRAVNECGLRFDETVPVEVIQVADPASRRSRKRAGSDRRDGQPPCRAQILHPGPNHPLIDLMQPTENRLRRGQVFSSVRGGLHHVYHWPATARMRFLRPTISTHWAPSSSPKWNPAHYAAHD